MQVEVLFFFKAVVGRILILAGRFAYGRPIDAMDIQQAALQAQTCCRTCQVAFVEPVPSGLDSDAKT